jgi:hypothetical protein
VRHLGYETQGTVGVDLRPQDRIEALKGSSRVRAVSQDLASVLAEKPGARFVEVKGICSERCLTFLAIESVLVPSVGIVPKEHPDVGGVLARRSVPSVYPSPDLEKDQSWQGRDVDGSAAGQCDRDGRRQGLDETRYAHDLAALRGPSDASVGSLHTTERNDVQALISMPKTMRWTVSRETTRSDESLAQALKDVPATNSQRQVRVLGGSLRIDAMRMNEEEVASGGAYQ